MRAGIYTRLSADRHGTGLAVARQEQDCRRLAALRGWDVVQVFTDNDLSGYKRVERPAYARMTQAIRAGGIEAVVAYSPDRLTRRVVELANLLDLCHERGVPVATVSGDLDTSTSTGRMVATIIGSVAQQESERVSERVIRKQDELAAKGLPSNGGRLRPYGYERDRMTLVDDEAGVIREAARRVLAGESLGGVAADLNRLGVPTVTGAPWSRTSLRSILLSDRVAGRRKHRGVVVGQAAWPAILDVDTSERLHAVIDRRGAATKAVASNARRYLLSGIARCSVCGKGLQVAHHGTRADGTPSLRYACAGRHAGRAVGPLDDYVIGAVLELLADPRVQAARRARSSDPAAARRLAVLRNRREQVVALLSDPDSPLTPAEVTHQVVALDRQIAEAESDLAGQAVDGLSLSEALTREQFDALPLSRRRALVHALLDVELHPSPRAGGRGFQSTGIVLTARLDSGTTGV